MEEFLKLLQGLIDESKSSDNKNKHEELYAYMNRNIKNKQMDASDVINMKASELILYLAIHINSYENINLYEIENNINKLKNIIDNFEPFDLFEIFHALEILQDQDGKFDLQLIEESIKVRWPEKNKKKVSIETGDPYDIIGYLCGDFKTIEDAMLFIKTIED